MNRICCFICFFLLISCVFAQEPALKQLELTSSPAYVLMGVQPTHIQRPSTPRDFAAGIQSGLVNGTLQPNFAMEVNPFNWNKKEPANNSHSFIANDYFDKRPWPAIKKNFALSLATSSTDSVVFGQLHKGTGIGYGIRITIIPGTVHKPTYNDFQEWATADSRTIFVRLLQLMLHNLASGADPYESISRAMERAKYALHERKDIPDGMKADISVALDLYKGQFVVIQDKNILLAMLDNELDTLTENKTMAAGRINQRITPFAREGFILELAHSGVSVLQNNAWGDAVFARAGIWLTPSYRLDLSSETDLGLVQSLDFLGIIRYIWNDNRVEAGHYLDFGVKFQFNRNDWNISFEGIARNASEVPENISSPWTYSWIGNLSYLITQDITLRFSFGSNFNGNTAAYSEPGGVIAVGGVNFGILR
ncbi:MAG: hypothetical protein K0B08_07565 [Bacteroidales bacterium]|nr:hypothetical protein [Bacteroidales bacterium]